jgi:hypothetical protein
MIAPYVQPVPTTSLPCTPATATVFAWGSDEQGARWRFRSLSGFDAYNVVRHPVGGYVAYGKRAYSEDGNDG